MRLKSLTALGALIALFSCQSTVQPAASPSHAPLPSPTPLPIGTASLDPGTADHPLLAAIVHIHGGAFVPATVYVRQAGTVTWINDDAEPHSAVPLFGAAFVATGPLAQGEDSGKIGFVTAGEQDYRCGFHPQETGKVIVEPLLVASPSP